MANTLALGASAARLAGSSPAFRTNLDTLASRILLSRAGSNLAPVRVIWINHEHISSAAPSQSGPDPGLSGNLCQVRVSVWDFQLIFGQASSESPEQVTIRNQQAVFLSPQQAKALCNVLGQNLAQYEQAFGTLNLEPHGHSFPEGPVN